MNDELHSSVASSVCVFGVAFYLHCERVQCPMGVVCIALTYYGVCEIAVALPDYFGVPCVPC